MEHVFAGDAISNNKDFPKHVFVGDTRAHDRKNKEINRTGHNDGRWQWPQITAVCTDYLWWDNDYKSRLI